MITPQLVKAARALLGWQQSELAVAANLSLTAVNNFERGIGTTRPGTVLAMQNSLEENGIEFLGSGGLRRIDEIVSVTRFSGNDFIAKWSEDIYAAVRKPGEKILTASTSEAMWHLPATIKINEDYLLASEVEMYGGVLDPTDPHAQHAIHEKEAHDENDPNHQKLEDEAREEEQSRRRAGYIARLVVAISIAAIVALFLLFANTPRRSAGP